MSKILQDIVPFKEDDAMSCEVVSLMDMARLLRRDIVDTVYRAKDGHPSPALSCADIVAALFFKVLRIDPQSPKWEDRDRFILSKGHACPVLYAALARRGYFSRDELCPACAASVPACRAIPVCARPPAST